MKIYNQVRLRKSKKSFNAMDVTLDETWTFDPEIKPNDSDAPVKTN